MTIPYVTANIASRVGNLVGSLPLSRKEWGFSRKSLKEYLRNGMVKVNVHLSISGMRIFHILLYLSSQMRMAEWQCHLWHLLRHAGRALHFGPLKYRIVRRRSPCALPGNRLWRWWTISSPKVSQFLWWRVGGPGWSPRGSNWQAQAVFDWVRIEWNHQNELLVFSLRDTCPVFHIKAGFFSHFSLL